MEQRPEAGEERKDIGDMGSSVAVLLAGSGDQEPHGVGGMTMAQGGGHQICLPLASPECVSLKV